MGRAENIIVFEDTVERCRDNQRLMESIRESCDSQVVVLESAEVPDGRRRAREQPRFSQPAQLVLTKERTFQAAEKYVRNPCYQGKRICVLNFASSMNPGGGVVRGASAQEESLAAPPSTFALMRFGIHFIFPIGMGFPSSTMTM